MTNEQMSEAILMYLGQMNSKLEGLSSRLDTFTADLGEFSERFDEVMTSLENERRLDRLSADYN